MASQWTARRIRSIPTLLLSRDGQILGTMVVAAPRPKIEAAVLRRVRDQEGTTEGTTRRKRDARPPVARDGTILHTSD